jgi:hypothetical protein
MKNPSKVILVGIIVLPSLMFASVSLLFLRDIDFIPIRPVDHPVLEVAKSIARQALVFAGLSGFFLGLGSAKVLPNWRKA